jgi:hypothetical protein
VCQESLNTCGGRFLFTWQNSEFYQDSTHQNCKIYPREENKVGTYDKVFPTRYIIKESKLFYWNDTTQIITQDIITVLERYNHIDFNWKDAIIQDIILAIGNIDFNWKDDDFILTPQIVHNDGVEGIVYYICKNDLKNYKKKRVDNLRKQYKIPKLKCR